MLGRTLERATSLMTDPFNYGDVAQLGEHLLCKEGVRGSSPLISIDPNRWASNSSKYIKKRIEDLRSIEIEELQE